MTAMPAARVQPSPWEAAFAWPDPQLAHLENLQLAGPLRLWADLPASEQNPTEEASRAPQRIARYSRPSYRSSLYIGCASPTGERPIAPRRDRLHPPAVRCRARAFL